MEVDLITMEFAESVDPGVLPAKLNPSIKGQTVTFSRATMWEEVDGWGEVNGERVTPLALLERVWVGDELVFP